MSTALSINPATGAEIAHYDHHRPAEIDALITTASKAQHKWRTISLDVRAECLLRLAATLDAHTNRYAPLITAEMGKPIAQAEAEVAKCAGACRYYAKHAEQLLAPQMIATEMHKSYITYQPLGVVLAIMPWNFPFFQVIRCAIPVILAGNTLLLKHASNVQGCAYALQEAFLEAGFIEGCMQAVTTDNETTARLIADNAIAAISLTGSDIAGSAVAAEAGRHIKKTVLELGGSDAYLVLDDADIARAAKVITHGRLQNTGQTCIAVKRVIALHSVYEELIEQLFNQFTTVTVGDPMDRSNDCGPMARFDLRANLHTQVCYSRKEGAHLLCGGTPIDGVGAYYPATILRDVTPGMTAFDRELFGPVLAISTAANEQQAIALANQSSFGLGGGVCTQNLERGMRIAHQLETGNVAINDFVRSDPRLPFGGVKRSGYGRELAAFGMREFVNVQAINVAT